MAEGLLEYPRGHRDSLAWAARRGEDLARYRNTFVVLSNDGTVVTVGRFSDTRKLKRRRKDGKARARRGWHR